MYNVLNTGVPFILPPATHLRGRIVSSVACPSVQYFSTSPHKRHDFFGGRGGGIIEYTVCVLIFSTIFA